jgi:hypothetical protein
MTMTQDMADVIGACAGWDGAARFAAELPRERVRQIRDEAEALGYLESEIHPTSDDSAALRVVEWFVTERGISAVLAAMDRAEVKR